MTRFSFKYLIIVLVIVVGSVFLNKYLFKNVSVFYPKFLTNFGSYLFTKTENFGSLVKNIKNFYHLASENDKLKQRLGTDLNLKAKIENLENENEFLRRSVRISQRLDYSVVDADIFNLNLSPTGYNVLLNKGIRDDISEGDIVITPEGILIGKIKIVEQGFSKVLFVSDPEFKITVKILGLETSGIARGALNSGMYLDFIIQEDEIKEQDILVSSGSDLFPPALIIGSVDHIENNPTQTFKKVRIRPAVKEVKLGKVLVIKIK